MAQKTKIMSDNPPIIAKHELFSKYEYCTHQYHCHFSATALFVCMPLVVKSFGSLQLKLNSRLFVKIRRKKPGKDRK